MSRLDPKLPVANGRIGEAIFPRRSQPARGRPGKCNAARAASPQRRRRGVDRRPESTERPLYFVIIQLIALLFSGCSSCLVRLALLDHTASTPLAPYRAHQAQERPSSQ